MMEQYDYFGSLNTCNHVEVGNFEKKYILRLDNKDMPINMM